nr:hypothetical protein [uncultured Sellimonas sp.]
MASSGRRIKDHIDKDINQEDDWLDIEWLDDEEPSQDTGNLEIEEWFDEDDWDTGSDWDDYKEEPVRKAEKKPSPKASSSPKAKSRSSSNPPKKRKPQPETGKEQKKKKGPSVAKPVKAVGKTAGKAGKAAGKAVGKGLSLVLKCGSFILMVLIVLKMFQDFWAQKSTLGEIWRVAADKNYAEGIYLGIAGILLLIGLISAFWILTGKKMADGGRVRSYDTGRGLTAFLFFGILVAIAGKAEALLPQNPQMLDGARLALQILDGMKTMMLGCCLAGVVLCVIRKVMRQ